MVLLAQVRALWKRIVLLLRTLYSVSLTLPAAQLARRAELVLHDAELASLLDARFSNKKKRRGNKAA